MRKLTNLIFISILIFTACGRKTTQAVSQSTPDQTTKKILEEAMESEAKEVVTITENPSVITPLQPHLLLSLQRTGGAGINPNFEIRLFSDGRILYKGIRDVERVGIYESQVSESDIEQLVREADNIRFFDLASKYPNTGKNIDVLPITITTMNLLSRARSVVNNYDAPRRLKAFEKYFINFSDHLNWRVKQ